MDKKEKTKKSNQRSRSIYVNGNILRSAIRIRNKTQQALSKELGLGINTINHAINNNYLERADVFIDLCKKLNISPFLLANDEVIHETEVITADTLHKYIDDYTYDYVSGLWTMYDAEEFFDADINSKIMLSELQKATLYPFVIELRTILTELASSMKTNKSIDKYIRDNLISELKKRGYRD